MLWANFMHPVGPGARFTVFFNLQTEHLAASLSVGREIKGRLRGGSPCLRGGRGGAPLAPTLAPPLSPSVKYVLQYDIRNPTLNHIYEIG